jgi:hypothetical protein
LPLIDPVGRARGAVFEAAVQRREGERGGAPGLPGEFIAARQIERGVDDVEWALLAQAAQAQIVIRTKTGEWVAAPVRGVRCAQISPDQPVAVEMVQGKQIDPKNRS